MHLIHLEVSQKDILDTYAPLISEKNLDDDIGDSFDFVDEEPIDELDLILVLHSKSDEMIEIWTGEMHGKVGNFKKL